jgi:hypothetical protein
MRPSRVGASLDGTIASSWRRCTFSRCRTSPGGPRQQSLATGTASGSGSGGSAARGYSRRFSNSWPRPARLRIWCRCSTARWCARMSRPPAQKGAARSGTRALAWWVLMQDPPQDGLRRPADPFSPDRGRGQRQHATRDIARHRAGHQAARGDDGQRLRLQAQPRGLSRARDRARYPAPLQRQAQACLLPQAALQGRARIEQAVGKLKRFKRVALRCEKTAESYAAFVAFACSLILVKSVHTA